VILYTDNQSACQILSIGRKRPALQVQARKIFALAVRHSFTLVPRWKRRNRKDLVLCNSGSKLPDDCDYGLDRDVFAGIERELRVRHTRDCFASESNALTPVFVSKYHCVGSLDVDAMALDWNARAKGERRPDNWLHPPRGMVGRVLRHMKVCGARGTVVVPLNTRDIWWPLVAAGAHGAV
jgi:hypothetical protein